MTETEPTSPPVGYAPSLPMRPGRHGAARAIILIQAPFLFLFAFYYLGASSPVVAGLCVAGAAVLLAGGIRMSSDRVSPPGGGAPWDWTDFVMFWPAAFTAGSLLASLMVPVIQHVTAGADSTVSNAVQNFVLQICEYAGALFNIFVLAGLRRGATLRDIGWRRFRWWWAPAALVVAFVTLYLADILQQFSQRLLPNATNTQCVAVQHDYAHFLVLAIVAVCVVAPLSEETIFRGFVYGWLRRRLPVALAIPISGAIFAGLHGVLLLFIPLFAVGCILAIVFQASKSLWPGAMVHALFNLPGIIAILSTPTC